MPGKVLELDPLRARLLAWFEREGRAMPWREEASPYRVWISEIMLQQTQVATVIPYFKDFIARFPDQQALAAASEEDVLALWSGLGYYRRARNLHKTARIVCEEHTGRLPETAVEWRKLPGIGAYTAGAIASIAFDQPEPALDGNGIRVLTRLRALAGDPKRQPLSGELWQLLEQIVQHARPGDLNQSVMELGASVCTPLNPRCDGCPVAASCLAYADASQTRYPELPKRDTVSQLFVEVGIFRNGADLLLSRGERPFLGELWNLPYRIVDGGGAFASESWSSLGLHVDNARLLGKGRHHITRYRIEQTVLAADVELHEKARHEYRWVNRRDLADLGLPAFSRKLLVAFDEKL